MTCEERRERVECERILSECLRYRVLLPNDVQWRSVLLLSACGLAVPGHPIAGFGISLVVWFAVATVIRSVEKFD